MRPDLFQAPDYYNLDDLLTDEHKLVRDSARAWVKKKYPQLLKTSLKELNSQNNLSKVLGKLVVLDRIYLKNMGVLV